MFCQTFPQQELHRHPIISPPLQGSLGYHPSHQVHLDQFSAQAYGTGSVLAPGSAPPGVGLAWHSLGTTPFNFHHQSPPLGTIAHDLAQATGQQQQQQQPPSSLGGQEQQASSSSNNNTSKAQAAVAAWAASLQGLAPPPSAGVDSTNSSSSAPPSSIISAANHHFPSTPPSQQTHHTINNNHSNGSSPLNRGSTQSPVTIAVSSEQGPTATAGMVVGLQQQQQQQNQTQGQLATANGTTGGQVTSVAMDISNSAENANVAAAAARHGLSLGDLPSWNFAMYVYGSVSFLVMFVV